MHIVDKDGEWFQNFGSYPLADGESGTVFHPGIPTKASVTKWLAQQPTIRSIPDPTAPAEVVVPAPAEVVVPVPEVPMPEVPMPEVPVPEVPAPVAAPAKATKAK